MVAKPIPGYSVPLRSGQDTDALLARTQCEHEKTRGWCYPDCPTRPAPGDTRPACPHGDSTCTCRTAEAADAARHARPSTAELAAIGRPGTVRASARAGSKAHLADLTEPQLRVLWAADNPAGMVSQNGSTGVTRPLIRAVVAKGYGTAAYDMQRRHLIVGFRINDRGRAAARARFGTPVWAGVHAALIGTDGLCYQNVPRPNGKVEGCAEPIKSPIHDPAGYLAYAAQLTAELGKWRRGEGEYADTTHVHPFAD